MNRRLLGILALGLVMLSGCASKQPTWLSEAPSALCVEGIETECLSKLVNRLLVVEPELDIALQYRFLALHSAGVITLEEPLLEQWTTSDDPEINRGVEAFTEAGESIAISLEGDTDRAARKAITIAHQPASDFALLSIIHFAAVKLDREFLGEVLNILSERNTQAYHQALQARLNGLLAIGDLERSQALRQHLLETAHDSGKHFELVARIAAAYAMYGLQGDAKAIAERAFRLSPALATADNVKLIEIALKTSAGDYPPEQDFFVFSNDEKRLEAYLMVSSLSQRSGNTAYGLRAMNDCVKLIQKSGYTGSKPHAILEVALMSSQLI